MVEYAQGDLKIFVEQGDNWLHDFPLFMGIKIKNSPQVAIWLEDTQGNYLSTVYVSRKIATQSWKANGGNPRKEALPHWQHIRATKNLDGATGATPHGGLNIQPITDGVTGATPRGSFNLKLRPTDMLKLFVVKIELNHSTDFNDYYPESTKEGEPNYSGGKEGSGQPAVVYAAGIDLLSGDSSFEAALIGHSSPDGTSGKIDADMSQLTTAVHIVKKITVTIQ